MSINMQTFFKRPTTASEDAPNPNDVARSLQRRDRILKEKFEARRLILPADASAIRIIPALSGSKFSWMLPFETYQLDGQPEIVVPLSVDKSRYNGDPIAEFRRYLYKNHKELAYTKADRNTYAAKTKLRLQSVKKGVLWFIHTNPEALQPKPDLPIFLLVGSNSDGEYGGQVGYINRIVKLTEEQDDDPSSPNYRKKLYGDITDPERGRNVIIRVSGQGRERKYNITASQHIQPLDTLLSPIVMDRPDLSEVLVPLEETLHIPTDEELYKVLESYLRTRGKESLLREVFGTETASPAALARETAAAKQAAPATPAPQPAATEAVEESDDDVSYTEAKPAATTPVAAKPAPTVTPKVETPAPKAEVVAPKVETPAPKAEAPAPTPAAEAAPAATADGVEFYPTYREDIKVLNAFTKAVALAQKANREVPTMEKGTEDAYFRVMKFYTDKRMPSEDKAIFEAASGM